MTKWGEGQVSIYCPGSEHPCIQLHLNTETRSSSRQGKNPTLIGHWVWGRAWRKPGLIGLHADTRRWKATGSLMKVVLPASASCTKSGRKILIGKKCRGEDRDGVCCFKKVNKGLMLLYLTSGAGEAAPKCFLWKHHERNTTCLPQLVFQSYCGGCY